MTFRSPPDEMTKQAEIQQRTVNGHIIWFDPQHFSVEPYMFTSSYWQAQNSITGQAKGRGITYFFKYNNCEFVLRHYLRGGLVGRFLDKNYIYTGLKHTRAWQEFNLLNHMTTLDLPCPIPVAAQIKRIGLYYQADIIIKKIPHAQDIFTILLERSIGAETWQHIGKTIAKFHQHQIYHHDLNIHNVMLDNQSQAWLIDFDKCSVKKGSHWKTRNLSRLHRSFVKEKKLKNIYWSEIDWQALQTGYVSN